MVKLLLALFFGLLLLLVLIFYHPEQAISSFTYLTFLDKLSARFKKKQG
ncbi:MAG: hypothetical protein MI740_00250 [Halanaerobiales bacterium]|nr:hypothetical protein [Halanaerobiales bacterium]